MDIKEIYQNKIIFASTHNVSVDDVYVIPKNELIIGETYDGNCRNSDSAKWNGNTFEYIRHKFGSSYMEEINHFEDDDGYDVFVPMKIKQDVQ